jgi:hypothetical protein
MYQNYKLLTIPVILDNLKELFSGQILTTYDSSTRSFLEDFDIHFQYLLVKTESIRERDARFLRSRLVSKVFIYI